jgi:hypothetical protein
MPAPAHRRPRYAVVEPKMLGYVVSKDTKVDFDRIALASGMSSSALFELVAKRLRAEIGPDEDARPSWLPQDPEALPIDSA